MNKHDFIAFVIVIAILVGIFFLVFVLIEALVWFLIFTEIEFGTNATFIGIIIIMILICCCSGRKKEVVIKWDERKNTNIPDYGAKRPSDENE